MAKKQRISKQNSGSKPNIVSKQRDANAWNVQWYASALVLVVGISVALHKRSTSRNSVAEIDDLMKQCTLVMANSSIPNSGWGMFTLVPLSYGSAASYGDPIVQIPDIESKYAQDLSHFLHRYAWDGEVTNGLSEGRMVYTALPGVGSLANGHHTMWNLAPGTPQVDEGSLHRSTSPGAGSITHYHNFSFYIHRNVEAGQEILVNYGKGWENKISKQEQNAALPETYLRREGLCLDHIRPGISAIPHAGRGAFAARSIQKGKVIAPAPLLPILSRKSMESNRGKKQLLLNYMFGHKNSSLLFFPYSPVVNLINHGTDPNAALRWSESSLHYGRHLLLMSEEQFKSGDPSGLLLEYVALRDIAPGEEILLDYGTEWSDAWKKHVDEWSAPESASSYEYPHIQEGKYPILRTPLELESEPYPPNIETLCFYRYSDNHGESNPRWVNKAGVFELRNLRPCYVMARSDTTMEYTVRMFNRRALNPIADTEKIPESEEHIVTNVPRRAIRLADRIYASDQHLTGAFRHEITFPDDLLPSTWQSS